MSDSPSPDSPSPKRAGWRGKAQAAARPTTKRGWTGDGQKPIKDAGARNRKRRMIAGFLVVASLVITGATIWYISQIPVSTPLLVLTITDYGDPVPPNAWAQEDFNSFSKAWPSTADDGFQLYPLRLPKTTHNVVISDKSQIWHPGNATDAKSDFLKRLEKLTPGGPGEKSRNGHGAVIIYLSGHGILDKQGRPCLLLPHDASLSAYTNADVGLPYLDESRRLPLEDLLAAIKEKLPATAHKLVVLDCHRIDLHFGLGVLYNDFAHRTEDLIRTQATPNLAVLTSASSNQIGWSSAPLGHSVFGEYVRIGLLGKADADGNDRITVSELATYVRDQTDRWVNRNCSDGQRPALLPGNIDFDLAFVSDRQASGGAVHASAPAASATGKPTGSASGSGEAAVAGSKSDPEAEWKEVDRLWEFVDDRSPWKSADTTGHRTGRRFADWESLRVGLVRLEQLKLSGSAYQSQVDTLQRTLSQTADRLTKSAMDQATPPTWHGLHAMQYWGDLKPVGSLPNLPGDGKSDPNVSTLPYQDRVSQAWRWAQTSDFDVQLLETGVRKYVTHPSAQQQTPEPLEFRFLTQLERLSRTAKSPASADRIKSVLRCREAAELAASGAGDERVIYWSRRLVEWADEKRRQAEDRLFCDDWADSDKLIQDATIGYTTASTRAAQLSHAMRVRNRAWGDLPHYVRWISRRPHRESKAFDVEAALIPTLRAIIHNNATLSVRWEALLRDQLSTADDNWTEGEEFKRGLSDVVAAAKEVENGLEIIETAFKDAVADALKKADNTVAWREAADLMALPLVKALDRKQLRARVLDQKIQEVDSRGKTTEPTSYERQWATRWDAAGHPIVDLLDRRFLESTSTAELGVFERPLQTAPKNATPQPADEAESRKAVDKLTNQGRQVAEGMQSLISTVHTLMDEPTPNELPKWFVQRDPRSRAERLFRVGTGMLPSSLLGSGLSLHDPIRRLQDFDLHHLAVWHGMRVADDFWGSGNRTSKSFFELAGRDYLNSAKRLPPNDSRLYRDLKRKLEDRSKAATIVLEPKIDANSGSQMGPKYDVVFSVAQASEAPLGISTFYVVEDTGTPDTRLGVSMHASAKSAEQKLTFTTTAAPAAVGAAATAVPQRTLVGYWRGHLREVPLKIDQQLPEGQFVYRPEQNREATVIVKGAGVEPGSVAIIFDCSSSMRLGSDGKEIEAAGISRMLFAKEAVKDIAKSLAAAKNYKVSLWFYGHRVGLQAKDGSYVRITNPDWPMPIPNGIAPGDDVEKVWSGTLNDQTLADINAKINLAKPFGVTPLYLSMVQTIDGDLRNAPATAPRQLIVITDGKDEVADGIPSVKPATTKSARDVTDLLLKDAKGAGNPIKVDMIACGDRTESDFFKNQLSATGVNLTVQPASNRDELKKRLSEALHLYDYDVVAVGSDTRAAGPEPMNKQVTIRGLRQGEPLRHRAALRGYPVSSEFALEGGELIELTLDIRPSGDMRLIHERYKGPSGWLRTDSTAQARTPDELLRATAADSFTPATYFVGAGTPDSGRDDDGPFVTFPITIQNGTPEKFSPRPAEVWVEITPLVDDLPPADTRPYAVYDVAYRANLPAPVFECKVRGWPQAARAAEIRLWWKPERAAVKLTRKLEIATNPTESLALDLGGGATATFTTGVTSSAKGVEVLVRERRNRESAGENDLPIRIEIDGVGRDADEIRRSYSRDGRATEHRFLFRGEVEGKVLAYELKISSAKEAKEGAVTLPAEKQTLKVRLPQQR